MKRILAIMLIFIISIMSLGCATSKKEFLYYSTLRFFNTDFSIRVYADKSKDGARIKNLFDNEMAQVAQEVENLMSISVEDSDISRYNSAKTGERVKIDSLTAQIINVALQMYNLTNGAYNPAVAMSVDLWGFSPRFTDTTLTNTPMPYDRQRIDGEYTNLPSQEYTTAFQSLCDLTGLSVEENEQNEFFITKVCPSVVVNEVAYTQALDLGGIAKGYVVAKCGQILAENGFEYGLVSLGSSSLSLKSFFDTDVMKKADWKISVASPNNRQPVLYFKASNCDISTSGTYEKCYYVDNKEYCHIIDSKTGCPTTSEIVSATVCGVDAVQGDALTTALCVMDLQTALDFVSKNLTNVQVILLTRDGEKFKAYTNIPSGEYQVEKSFISKTIQIA